MSATFEITIEVQRQHPGTDTDLGAPDIVRRRCRDRLTVGSDRSMDLVLSGMSLSRWHLALEP